jgi:integrase
LWLDAKRQQWVIRDGPAFIRTGRARDDAIGAEKELGDYIAAKYQPARSPTPMIADVLLAYARDVVPHTRTARNTAYIIGALTRFWGTLRIEDVTAKNCRAYAAQKTQAAARSHLEKLAAAIKHWHREYGPLAFMPELTMPAKVAPRERWLTRPEAARLLRAAKMTEHMKRFILISLYTGTRSGAVLDLKWDWIDLESGIMRRMAPGSVGAANKRRPPVRLGTKLLGFLRRWKRDGAEIVVHYDGRKVADPHTAWARACRLAKLDDLRKHDLRHTRATWLMQSGKVTVWEAAGALGMTVRTLESVYGHHHPDWQKGTASV